MRGRLALAIVAVALLAQGCQTVPPPVVVPDEPPAPRAAGTRVLASDEQFVVLIAGPGDTLASLAERFLGSADRAWWIAEFNHVDAIAPGQDVVIPRRAPNALGINKAGIQTVPILCYHRFGTQASGRLQLSAAAFEAQMAYLARNGYNVVPLAMLPAFLEGREPLPPRAVVITIDDGYRSTYDIAFPILKKYRFPATVFLYTDFVGAGDALTWKQIKEMVDSNLIQVQPHSKTHANLTIRLPGESDAKYRERLRREVEGPSALIRERTSREVDTFAYPYGDVNPLVAETLRRDNIRLGLTVTPGGNAFYAPPLMLRRTMVYGGDDIEVFKSKLAVFTPIDAQ